MGFIDRITGAFRRTPPTNIASEDLRMISGYQPRFSSYNGKIYEMEMVRSAIERFARHCSKLKPEIIGDMYQDFGKTLLVKPNPFQTTAQFLARVATILKVDTTCFIIPMISNDGYSIDGFYPLLARNVQILNSDGQLWLAYTFANGERAYIEYDRVGVMVNHQYANELFGDSNNALSSTLSVLHTQNEGIQDAIKQGAAIRFMAKVGTVLRPDDLEKERKKFTEQNLSSDNKTGVMIFGANYTEVKQIDSKPFVVDAEQMKFIRDSIYNYFGVNEKILQNSFSEDEWNAYYEGEIEPFAIQLSMAITNMTFTVNELAHGNSIHFSSNRLQYASNSTKLQVTTALADRGILGSHAIAEIWNLPKPVEDVYYIRGEYLRKETSNSEDVNKKEKKEVDEISKVNYEEVSNDQ